MAQRRKPDSEDSLVKSLDDLLEEDHIPQSRYRLHTGLTLLDLAICSGEEGDGVPGGTYIEAFGEPSSGKNVIAMEFVKSAQAAGGMGILLDEEGSFDEEWAATLGVQLAPATTFIVRRPPTLETTCAMIEKIVEVRRLIPKPTVIILDSVASLVAKSSGPKKGKEGRTMMDPIPVSEEARKLAWFFKRGIIREIAGTQIVLFFINQLRDKLDSSWGKPTTTPGGRAVKHYAHVRLKVEVKKPIESSDGKKIGHFVQISVVKNKVGTPHRYCVVPFYYKYGLDNTMSLINFAMSIEAIKKEGLKYRWGETLWKKGDLRDALNERTGLYSELQGIVRTAYLAQQ